MSSNIEFWEDYEALVVETPENLPLRLPLAGFGPRFLAALLDYILVTILLAIIIMVAMFTIIGFAWLGPEAASQTLVWFILIILLAVLLATFGYYALFEWLWNGQTPGKRITGIRVVRRGGLPLTLREVLLRNVFRLLDMLPSNGFIGLVSFFATRHQQRLGDLVADTVVIREFGARSPFAWLGTVGAGRGGLTPQLRYVIGSYLGRAPGLPADARYRISDAIIARLGYTASQLSLSEREAYLAQVLNWQPGTRG